MPLSANGWSGYAGRETGSQELAQLMQRLGHVRSSGRISRDEMNER